MSKKRRKKKRKRNKLSFKEQMSEIHKSREKSFISASEFEKALKEDNFDFDLQEISVMTSSVETGKKYLGDLEDDDDEVHYLPYETMLEIFSFYSYVELVKTIARVCRGWNLLSCTNVLWEELYMRHFVKKRKVFRKVMGVDMTWKNSFLLMLETRERWKRNKPNIAYHNLTREEIKEPQKVLARKHRKKYIKKVPYHPTENPDNEMTPKARKHAQVTKLMINDPEGSYFCTNDSFNELTVFNLRSLSVNKILKHGQQILDFVFYRCKTLDENGKEHETYKIVFSDSQGIYIWNFQKGMIEKKIPKPNTHTSVMKLDGSQLFVNQSNKILVFDLDETKIEKKKKEYVDIDRKKKTVEKVETKSDLEKKKVENLKNLLKDKEDIGFLYPEVFKDKGKVSVKKKVDNLSSLSPFPTFDSGVGFEKHENFSYEIKVPDQNVVFNAIDISEKYIAVVTSAFRIDVFLKEMDGIHIQSIPYDQKKVPVAIKIDKDFLICFYSTSMQKYHIRLGKAVGRELFIQSMGYYGATTSNMLKIKNNKLFILTGQLVNMYDLATYKKIGSVNHNNVGGTLTAYDFDEMNLVFGTQRYGIIKRFFGPSELYWAGMKGGFTLSSPSKK